MIRVNVELQLKGEDKPRPLVFRGDFVELADLDREVNGLDRFEPGLLWHMAALLWISSGANHDMSLREFGSRLDVEGNPGRVAELRKAAMSLWQPTQ